MIEFYLEAITCTSSTIQTRAEHEKTLRMRRPKKKSPKELELASLAREERAKANSAPPFYKINSISYYEVF
ncbi:hypothetical protein OESDEN_23435 [Oesophagostomum dentatum]|uniref:Uncharacterized protein n=1 Tax=Oesophagostomum dentatum TaxID=61180 RepID=A0A0B1RZ63_OESDE|nr:hypothetical protein OESDEN_23435 [Oesophagostomum dentatum]